MWKFSIFLLCFFTVLVNGQDNLKKVNTKSGPVEGRLEKTIFFQKSFYSYKGIPYAQPPVGELRFKAPKSVKKWNKTLEAYEYGSMCPQTGRLKSSVCEDCLFLNVFQPIVKGNKKLPVAVMIPGGFFIGGHGGDDYYGPDFFMENEIVLVTMNIRLGALGFMSLGLPEYSGNMAMKDQQLALEWIYNNIAAFGGDKEKITMGGVSSASIIGSLNLINKKSSKYFKQFLGMSGSPIYGDAYQTGDHSCLMKHFYKQQKGTTVDPTDEQLIKFLQEVEVSKIVKFSYDTISNGQTTPWSPIVEYPNAKNPFLQQDPMTQLQQTTITKPSYYTVTKYEHSFFVKHSNYSEPAEVNAFLDQFYFRLPIFGYRTINSKKPAYLQSVFDEVRDFYFANATDETDRLRQRIILDSDLYATHPIEKWLEKHVARSQSHTFYHRFSYDTILNRYVIAGASHADEQCFLFRCKGKTELQKRVFANKDSDEQCSAAFKAMMNIQKLISNFIKFGSPVHDGQPTKAFAPVKRSNKPYQFNFIDLTNEGFIAGKGPNAKRMVFLDKFYKKVEDLVKRNGDTPNKSPIQQQCDDLSAST
ncbi:esterase B1-like [Contarinia nasturtii]|uniref:esterase B1-like n=1 Tax=Contarinia nasturtii TaxID=265458 RepID=UPI0012D39749|nr:esterase B1-like [Contarinia nasturtii]